MQSRIEEDKDLFLSLFGGILLDFCKIKQCKSVVELHTRPIRRSSWYYGTIQYNRWSCTLYYCPVETVFIGIHPLDRKIKLQNRQSSSGNVIANRHDRSHAIIAKATLCHNHHSCNQTFPSWNWTAIMSPIRGIQACVTGFSWNKALDSTYGPSSFESKPRKCWSKLRGKKGMVGTSCQGGKRVTTCSWSGSRRWRENRRQL